VTLTRIDRFGLKPGKVLASNYVVEQLLGEGWEGEVYRVRERSTGIRRALKLFFPQRNRRNQTLRRYAKKLEKLKRCELAIHYHHSEVIDFEGHALTCLVSELVEGPILSDFVKRQPGGRLRAFEALHLVHALSRGLEEIHGAKEYHGDLHAGNVLVKREGIFFRPRLFDFMSRNGGKREHMLNDIVDLTRLLYDAVGGKEHYRSQPEPIKAVCCGLRSDLVKRRYPTARHLRKYLETFEW